MTDFAAVLRESLKSSSVKQTLTGKLREIYDLLEEAKKAGIRQEQIVKILNENGFENATIFSLKNTLVRIRSERKNGKKLKTVLTPKKEALKDANHKDDKKPSSLLAESTDLTEKNKISTPTELRNKRNRDINLEDYTE